MIALGRVLVTATLCVNYIRLASAIRSVDGNPIDTSSFNLSHDANGCLTVVHEVNPLIHKALYRVGMLAGEGREEHAMKMYGKIFGEYLSATAGMRFNPPVLFEFVPVSHQAQLMDMVDSKELDFVFSLTAMFSCLSAEHNAQPLATIVSRGWAHGYTYELDVFAGVMFVRKDNKEIQTVQDFKEKVIGATSITSSGGGQIQFSEMVDYGLSLMQGPKQVVFTGDENTVIQGVLDGTFEVGFTWSGRIEEFTNANGTKLDVDTFRIINAQTHLLDDGMLFPYVSSTILLPERPVVALGHVDKTAAKEVQEALLSFQSHHQAYLLGENLLCDTTPYLAELAHNASVDGSFAGFRTARSYAAFRTLQEAAGFLVHDNEAGNWKCVRAERLWEDMECPPKHIMLPEEQFKQSCDKAGLTCHENFECFCQPCVPAFLVDVFQHPTATEDGTGCDKMTMCGQVQQTKVITFHAVDNLKRENPFVEALLHVDGESITLPAATVAPFTYQFTFSDEQTGTAILEVFFDGEQIPESPFRVEILARDCDEDYPGLGKVADAYGACTCGDSTLEVQGKCVQAGTFAIIGCTLGALVVALCALFYMKQKTAQNDEIWQVHPDELHFDDPMEVIGQGSFGVVLLAEYRGTKVAIKRVLPTKKKTGGNSRKGTRSSLSTGGPAGDHSAISQDDLNSNDGNSNDGIGSPSDTEAGNLSSKVSSGILASKTRGDPGSSSISGLHFSVAFLNQEFNLKGGKWANYLPWNLKRQSLGGNSFQNSVIGTESYSRAGGLQVLCPWLSAHGQRRAEFKTEMRVLARLRHPCITTVMGAVVTANHNPVMVMEYMEYGSLHDLLRNETMPLTGEVILQITRDLAQGLRFLHSSKPPILHGDLKARNILIDSRFRAKLCDFGLSTKRVNEVSGTPFWMAPEYLMGGKYNPACDMYSVGILLYEIYARKGPYSGENHKDVIRGICNRRVNRRPVIPAATPPKFVDLMKKCWSPDVHVRPIAMGLDVALLEMSAEDAEPFQEGQTAETKKQDGDRLLYEIFPKHVADALKKGQKVDPETHENVTVIFSDIIKFTDISRLLSPEKVCDMLDRLYVAFDNCARRHQVFKVETIGDAWMGVTNLENNQNHTHVKHIAEFAVDIINEGAKVMVDTDDPGRGFLSIRVGFHSGSVVSNVIGSLNKRYCLFGDTVNTASRMESNSVANRILCSERSYKLLRDQAPAIQTKLRSKIQVKGKGEMDVYWVGDNLLIPRMGLTEKNVEFALPETPSQKTKEPAGIDSFPGDISKEQRASELPIDRSKAQADKVDPKASRAA